jgi:hypothetical protein
MKIKEKLDILIFEAVKSFCHWKIKNNDIKYNK